MKKNLIPLLACPTCTSELSFTAFSETDASGHIADGVFICQHCKKPYPLIGHIPRFIEDAWSRNPTFTETYRSRVEKLGVSVPKVATSTLKDATIRNFGSEWETWSHFGWGNGQDFAGAKRHFDYKVLFTKQEIQQKRVLDAGCGNGRYSRVALDYGAEVISVDLSHAVDVAHNNLKHYEKAHIVQADLFHLPFKKETFDFIFSNGVLMHTGNAKKAFLGLVPLLAPHGKITIHLYHKGNIVYELVDASLRLVTTRLPLSLMYKISKIGAAIANVIPHWFLHWIINAFVRLEPHPHYIFDWYTAPIATHHTYPEVYAWLDEAGLFLHHDHNATSHPFVRTWIAPFLFMTVKAGREPVAMVQHTTT